MNYRIPLFALNYDSQEEEALVRCLRGQWISTGPATAEFEKLFAEMLGVDHAVALANCTVALHLAMVLGGIKPGDEVICPSLTFVATVNAIRYVGAVPVFADIQSAESPTLDPGDVTQKITGRTKGMIVMHYGGYPCPMNELMEIAKKHNLRVIEDACHGPLSEYQGRKLGTIGDIGCFSFFSNKNISTGEGGMLVTQNRDFAERAKLLRSHGMTTMSFQRASGHATSYDVVEAGYNYRMDDMRANLGIVQLGKLKSDLESRARIRARYLSRLEDCADITIPHSRNRNFSSNYIMPVVLNQGDSERRDRVRATLAADGIQTSVHYPPVHLFKNYREANVALPRTEAVARRLITLPMYAALSEADVDFIADSLIQAIRE